MLHVDDVVIRLRETARDGFDHTEEAIEQLRPEKRIMNEVVRHAIDVGVDHQRVNEAEDEHHPERRVRKQKVEPEKVGEMKKPGRRGQSVQSGESEKPRYSSGPLVTD